MQSEGTLLLVLGLAGSGKSHVINALAKDFVIEENFAPAEDRNIAALVCALNAGEYCIVSERKYRSKKERDTFIARVKASVNPPPAIHFMCFENDLAAANHNCMYRENKDGDPGGKIHVAQNEGDTLSYEIPENAVVLKIHRVNGGPTGLAQAPPEAISLRCVNQAAVSQINETAAD